MIRWLADNICDDTVSIVHLGKKVISIINPFQNAEWVKFITRQENAAIFHHPAWLSVLQRQYGLKVFVVCSLNERGEIESGVPFCEVRGITGKVKWVSLPFSDMCPPLSDGEDALKKILDYCIEINGPTGSVEIRYSLPEHVNIQQRTDAVVHTTILPADQEVLFQSFKKTQIQQPIVKSQKEGLYAVVSIDPKGINEFYSLHLKTRKRLGVPIQPKRFFRILFEQLIAVGLGFIILIYKDSNCIGAGVFCGFAKVLTYKYSASNEKYLKLRPNNLMLWTAMQEAIKRGYTRFDFGRTDNDNLGLRKFKSGWGSVEEPLYYSYYPSVPSRGLFSAIKRNIVAPVIRNSPSFVCRLSGELLYKYFA